MCEVSLTHSLKIRSLTHSLTFTVLPSVAVTHTQQSKGSWVGSHPLPLPLPITD